jgi:uncharacterized protein involved in exopolysaccharide biosynthesis
MQGMEEQFRPDERLHFNARPVRAENGYTEGRHADDGHGPTFTLRYLLGIGFRHQWLIVLSFVLILSMAFVFVTLRPATYEAQMKILVKRERVDPLVSPDQSSQQAVWLGVTEEELNSEVELLKSRDLLGQVVVAAGLHERKGTGIRARLKQRIWGQSEETEVKDRKIASAVERVASQLEIQPLRKSAIIQVSYASPDPELAAAVLTTLADRYLDKHLAVHRPSGAFDFFEHETERYRGELALVQARLTEQNRQEAVISVHVEKENALRRAGDLEATEQATQAQIAETAARIQILEAQIASTPVRETTEVRRGPALLPEQLHTMLATHELKRIELLRVFQPSYPLVQEVEAQIAKLQGAIAAVETSPMVDETTDRNPTYDYLKTELAKSRSELEGLRARATATARSLAVNRERALRLEQVALTQQPLVRAAAQAEQNYLTYSRKREESRIANALDAQRILNVAIAEKATVPFEPSGPPGLLLMLVGALCAGFVSVGLACAADYLDPSFRTPDEVQAFLGSPVLASIPRHAASAESTT